MELGKVRVGLIKGNVKMKNLVPTVGMMIFLIIGFAAGYYINSPAQLTPKELQDALDRACQDNDKMHEEINNLLSTKDGRRVSVPDIRLALHDVTANCRKEK